jgi:hypothetical protein
VANERVAIALDISGITPGVPLTRVTQLLQDTLDGSTYSSESGDLTFTVAVLGIVTDVVEVRDSRSGRRE